MDGIRELARGLRVLLIEDNPGDIALLRRALKSLPELDVEWYVEQNLHAGIGRLQTHREQLDLVFVDLHLPDAYGKEVLTSVYNQAPELPIIVLTGTTALELASWAMRNGAQDYIVKGEYTASNLERSMRYAIGRKHAEESLRKAALYDGLTGLPNRGLFLDRLLHELQRMQRDPGYRFAVMYIDLDRFKSINDGLGHQVGDQLLFAAGQLMQRCVRNLDSVARLGGDEFAILLSDIRDESSPIRVAQRLQQQLREPLAVGDHQLRLRFSIGISLCDGEKSPEELMRQADLAMYQAKSQPAEPYVIFDRSMHERALDRLHLEAAMRSAIEDQLFQLYYQPILDLNSRQVLGFEALLRWIPEAGPPISPATFLPIAQESALLASIEAWVLDEAIRQLSIWHTEHPQLSINVNISATQLSNRELPQQIRALLNEHQPTPGTLNLEFAESSLLDDADQALQTLALLQDQGIKLQIDDFGAGPSSLHSLLDFPVDVLKIDQSFVQKLERGPHGLLDHLIQMAHYMDMKVSAEGIESQAQAERLRQIGCDRGQGYLFSEALPPEKAYRLLTKSPTS